MTTEQFAVPFDIELNLVPWWHLKVWIQVIRMISFEFMQPDQAGYKDGMRSAVSTLSEYLPMPWADKDFSSLDIGSTVSDYQEEGYVMNRTLNLHSISTSTGHV